MNRAAEINVIDVAANKYLGHAIGLLCPGSIRMSRPIYGERQGIGYASSETDANGVGVTGDLLREDRSIPFLDIDGQSIGAAILDRVFDPGQA